MNVFPFVVAATAVLCGCGTSVRQSPVDGGGVSFDFEKLSAEIFRGDPSQPNLAAGAKWTHSGRKEVAFKEGGGEFSIVAPADVRDNDISCWDTSIDLGPNPDGLVIRISFLYRAHGMDGRNARTYCIPYDTKKPGSYATAHVSHSDGFNWFQFSKEFKVEPGITRFRLNQRRRADALLGDGFRVGRDGESFPQCGGEVCRARRPAVRGRETARGDLRRHGAFAGAGGERPVEVAGLSRGRRVRRDGTVACVYGRRTPAG